MGTTTQLSGIVGGEVFDGKGFVRKDVGIAVERFGAPAEGEELDAAGCYVIPGLVDIHFHGSAGGDMSDGDLQGLHKMGAYEASRGITALCPATMTLPEDVLMRAAQAASELTRINCCIIMSRSLSGQDAVFTLHYNIDHGVYNLK